MCIDPTGDDNYLIIVLGVIIGIGGLSGATGTAGLVTWLQKRKKSSKKSKQHLCTVSYHVVNSLQIVLYINIFIHNLW